MSQALRHIQQTLRRLRRRLGLSISVCNITESVNLDTGVNVRTITSQDVKRALVLNGVLDTQSITMRLIQFAQTSGVHDVVDRTFIFDPNDLGDFIITTDSYIVYDSQKYQVLDVDSFEQNAAIVVPCKRTVGDPFVQVWTGVVNHNVALTEVLANA